MMFFRKIVNIIQGPLKQIDRIAMKFEFANKPIKDDPGISKLMKITLPNLNEMVLNLNNYKKKFYGRVIAPSYYSAIMKMVIFGHFDKSEPRDGKRLQPCFLFSVFHDLPTIRCKKLLLKTLLSMKLSILKNLLRNSNHFHVFR